MRDGKGEAMTTTPPAVRTIVEPPTPLHGSRLEDLDSPALRRSTRSAKPRTDRTPSPPADETPKLQSASSVTPPRRSARTASGARHNFSPSSSDPASPPTLKQSKHKNRLQQGPTQGTSASMLPTPAKTPRKKEIKSLPPASRVLFPGRPTTVEEAMPTPRKRARKALGYSLDSFDDPQAGPQIEIFTDSKDKVPELDTSKDNPFYVEPGKKSRSKKKERTLDHNAEVQEALEREEGMIYVFRGKKIYRKFEPDDDDELPHGLNEASNGLDLESLQTPRRLTRSSIKPRLLFPSATHQQKGNTTSDEEATTDIENEELETKTPMKSKHTGRMPATPPDSNRPKRKGKSAGLEPSPAGEKNGSDESSGSGKGPSPFMSWQRIKAGQSSTQGKKRSGEELSREVDTKKAKG